MIATGPWPTIVAVHETQTPDSLVLPAAPELDGLAVELGEQRLRERLLGEGVAAPRVGRFVLERQLGSGGMGTVWLAVDAKLGRPVALKFLRRLGAGEAGERRLVREAQGLARLSHPNVIPVFDVGRHEGRVWLAMEYVPGRTLRAWQRSEDPSMAARLEAWLAVGRGLAAVHAAGLVHRDVKPDNAMIGDDGRVRLVDFGLVRAIDGEEDELGETLVSADDAMRSELTATAQFVGTPAYAAPEQRRGERAGPAADQYAFCVSLWESLCGERPPQEGQPARAGRRAQDGGAPGRVSLNRRVHAALIRGLAPEPDQRFADMDSLLAALAPRPARWAVPGLLVTALASAGLAVVLDEAPRGEDDPCAQAGEAITTVWTAERRAQLEGRAAREPIDAWVEAWRGVARQSCAEVHVERSRSTQVLDRRSVCLDRASNELEALLHAVEADTLGDAATLGRWLAGLSDPRECLSPAVAEAELSVPPEHGEEIAAAHRELFAARFGIDASALDQRVATAERVALRAGELDWAPLRSDAARTRGALALTEGRAREARDHFGQAMDFAHALDDDLARIDAQRGLTHTALLLELDAEAAQWSWERHRALVGGLGDDSVAEARLLSDRGEIEHLRGELEAAERSLMAAVGAWERSGSQHDWSEAKQLRQLAAVVEERGRGDEALALLERARALELLSDADLTGKEHNESLFDDGVTALHRGDFEAAESALTEALTASIAREGPRGLYVAKTHIALSGLHDARGDIEAAREHARRAEQICAATLGADHPERANALSALATAQYRAAQFEDAAANYRRVVDIAERQLPATSIELGLHWLNLGDALTMLERDAEAEAALTRALTTFESELEPDHPYLAVVYKSLGSVALHRDRVDEARMLLERALAIHTATEASLVEAAEVRWLLAQVEAEAGDRARAREHAEAAHDNFAALGEDWRPRADEIRTWLNTNDEH